MPNPVRMSVGRQLLLRKSVEQIQRESAASQLRRSLGPLNLMLLGVGCIVGAGIFVRTGNAAALHAGPAVLISFVIAGAVCSLAGLCYAELSSTLPVSGSAYTYSYTTLGEFAAWLVGSLLVLEYGLAASVVAVGWSGYMVSLLGDLGLNLPAALTGPMGQTRTLADGTIVETVFNLPASLVCIALAALLTVGVNESARVNNVIVGIKVGVILAFIAVGGYMVASNWDKMAGNWDPFIPPPGVAPGEFGWGGVMRAASIVFFAYLGFEAVSTAGQEARDPQRDMPIGIIGSLVICTGLYVLVSVVLTLVVDYRELNVPDPVAVAVDRFGPDWGWFAMLIKVGAVIGLTSVILVLMYGQTRIFYTMARDGLIPRVFSRVHPRLQTPLVNTVATGMLVSIGAGVFDINTLGDMTSVGTLTAFSIVCLTVIVLRRTHPTLPRGFAVPAYPLIPLAGIAACAGLILTVETRVLSFLGWYVVGAVALYFAYGRRHSVLAGRSEPADATDLPVYPEDGP